jgi:hypothetical protein
MCSHTIRIIALMQDLQRIEVLGAACLLAAPPRASMHARPRGT